MIKRISRIVKMEDKSRTSFLAGSHGKMDARGDVSKWQQVAAEDVGRQGEAGVGECEVRLLLSEGHTTPGMQTIDIENQQLGPPPNRSASEQEKEPARVKSTRQRFLPDRCKLKKAIIGIVISFLIFGPVLFFLGTLVPLNHQQDAIKCPPDWIGHQGHCYKLSGEEKNWTESQNVCISHAASLAKITQEEKAIMKIFTRGHIFWIGLKREPGQPWKWLDGENATLEVLGNGGDCAYLDDDDIANSGRCTTEHRFICKKI